MRRKPPSSRKRSPASSGEEVFQETAALNTSPSDTGDVIAGDSRTAPSEATLLVPRASDKRSGRSRSSLAESGPAMVWVTEPDGYCTYLNERWYEFTGQGPGEGKGLGWINAIHPEDAAAAREAFILANQNQSTYQVEFRLRRRDGEYRWVIDSAQPRLDADGRFLGFVGSVMDITERKQMEDALRKSEVRYRSLMEQAQDSIFLADADGRFLLANASGCKMLGYSMEELQQLNVADTYLPEERLVIENRMAQLRCGEHLRFERTMLRKDGSTVEAEVSVNRLSDGLCHATIRPITERRRTEFLFDAQRRSLEMVVSGAPLDEVLTQLVRSVETYSGGDVVASILLMDHEGRLRNGASPGLPGHYLEAIDGIKADANLGTCAAAAATGKVVVTRDFDTDPKWAQLKHLPQALGFRGAWSQPIIARNGEVLGTFGTYFTECREPSSRERQAVGILAHTASLAIERARSEAELRESRERLQASLHAGGAGTFRWNMRDDSLEFDEALNRLFGFKPDHGMLHLRSVLSVIHPDDRKEFARRCEHCRRTAADFEMDFRIVLPDGTVRWIEDRGKTFVRAGGQVDYMTGACVDITDRKRAQRTIQESSDRLNLAIKAADLGVWFCNLPFGKLIWDDKVKEHFWLPPDAEVTIELFFERIHPEDRERTKSAIERALAERELFKTEYRTVSPKGEIKWIRAMGCGYYNDDGDAIGFDGVTLDISLSVKARETLAERRLELERLVSERTASLQEAIAQMEEFSYSVSHDLRAPLRAMRGYAQILLHEYGDGLDDEGQSFLKRIDRASERMEKLTHDMLTLSRIARTEMELKPVALQVLIQDIVAHHPALQGGMAQVDIEPLPSVLAHEPSLGQAISNILDNAVKFVPPAIAPAVKVSAEIHGDRVRLWIRDNGIGIKPEYRSRLFGMFERLQVDPKYSGTGIGLAISRKAVERMGGSIGVESDGLNGSAFWIELQGIV
ncbi:MAG: PAS domain S-box protein [Limisphaerales bacterium]